MHMTWKAWALGAALTTVCGCSQPAKPVSLADDPAAACASAETAAGVKSVILANLDAPPGGANGQSYQNQIVAGAQLTIARSAVQRFDPRTSTLSCSADARFTWPADLAARLAALSPNADWASDTAGILYTIQPRAGGGFDYSVQTGSGEIAGMVQSMATTLAQSDAKVPGVPAAAVSANPTQGSTDHTVVGPTGADGAPADGATGSESSRAASGAPAVATLTR